MVIISRIIPVKEESTRYSYLLPMSCPPSCRPRHISQPYPFHESRYRNATGNLSIPSSYPQCTTQILAARLLRLPCSLHIISQIHHHHNLPCLLGGPVAHRRLARHRADHHRCSLEVEARHRFVVRNIPHYPGKYFPYIVDSVREGCTVALEHLRYTVVGCSRVDGWNPTCL